MHPVLVVVTSNCYYVRVTQAEQEESTVVCSCLPGAEPKIETMTKMVGFARELFELFEKFPWVHPIDIIGIDDLRSFRDRTSRIIHLIRVLDSLHCTRDRTS